MFFYKSSRYEVYIKEKKERDGEPLFEIKIIEIQITKIHIYRCKKVE